MKILFFNASLRNKIIVITCFISFVVALMMSSFLGYREYQREAESFTNRIKLEGKIISDTISSALIFNDEETIEEAIDSFQQDQSIILIEVYDAQNVLFYKSEKNNINNKDQKIVTINEPVMLDGEVIGDLHIQATNFQLDNKINDILQTTIFNLVLSITLSVILAILLQRLISTPIIRLYKTSALIAETQDYRLRAEEGSEDEVGQLSRMFNQMLIKVEQRDGKLEKLVEQRTLELEKLADEFRHRAFHDSLTGLPNRALLSERFDLAVEHANRHKNLFACLLLDLDNFKTINDTKGHNYGDNLLIEVAHRLKLTVRKEDLVCRLGGDEFIVLLIDLYCQDDLLKALDKIIEAVGRDYYIHGELVKTGVSIGASYYPRHGDDLNSIKRKADVAMYKAKDAGKNCYFIYTNDMQERVKHRMMIQTDLDMAIKEEQLVLYFQPKIDLFKNKARGCEVLIRWNHPKEGFMTPNDFIPFAEETTQILELDYYVLRKSCEALSRWKNTNHKDINLAVNLSGRHFTNDKIVHVIKKNMEYYDIKPSQLEIEITEAVLIDDPEVAQHVVTKIKDIGLKLSLDDFGTGYSSLSYLKTLPIDCIKLDHTFVQQLDMNEQDRRLIIGVISLGKGLELELVAEGVETEGQLEILRTMQCDYAQGYYFLKPMPEDKLLQWLDQFNA